MKGWLGPNKKFDGFGRSGIRQNRFKIGQKMRKRNAGETGNIREKLEAITVIYTFLPAALSSRVSPPRLEYGRERERGGNKFEFHMLSRFTFWNKEMFAERVSKWLEMMIILFEIPYSPNSLHYVIEYVEWVWSSYICRGVESAEEVFTS